MLVPSGFSIVTPFATTVPPGGSTVLILQLDAAASGMFSGTASFGTNDVDRNPFSFNVYGEVGSDVGPPSVTVLGPSGTVLTDGSGVFSFGHTADGSPTSRTFTVRNDGTGSLTLDAASLQLPAGFSLVTSFASELAAGAASSFTIRLDAGSTGHYQGAVSFANNDPYRNPYSFHVEGTVLEPAPEISVRYQTSGGYVQEIYDGNSTVYFPSTAEGQAVSRTFTVHNVGAAPLTLDPASLSLPAGYSLISAFATEVAPGTSTAFVVQLDSQSPGHFSGTLSFANNDADENPFDFFLYGYVTASHPEIAVRYTGQYGYEEELYHGYSHVGFGSASVGVPIARTFTVYNTGLADLTLDPASLSLPTGFSLLDAFASPVSAGASTAFTIQLDAAAAGQFQGAVSVSSNAPTRNPFTWTIAGTVGTSASVVSVAGTRDAVEGGQVGYVRLLRTGDTSQEQTVYYSIDAMASQATPGVDFSYLSGSSAADPLHGSVTFGLDASYADIAVVAISNGVADGDKTLRIVLTADSSGYELGSPSSATILLREAAAGAVPTISIGRLADEVQTVVLPDATGGTWTIALDGQVSDPLAHDTSALAVQAALESLPTVGAGNVTVSGTGRPSTPLSIAFRGALRATDLPAVQVDTAGLSGIAQPAAAVAVVTEGVDGVNEAYEIVVRSLDFTTDLATSGGSLRFYWGPVDPQTDPFDDPQRQSPAVAWNAPLTEIENAIGQIPHLADAGGAVIASEVAASPQMRRLRVEFAGELGSRTVSELVVHNDTGGTPVTDVAEGLALVETSQLAEGAPGHTNEVQAIALSHAQAGSFQISHRGLATPPIAWDATAASLQQQLEALDSIGQDNVRVTGTRGGPWQVTFRGHLGGRNVELLAVDGAGLVGGQALVTTVSEGGAVVDATQNAREGSQNGWFRLHRTGSLTESLTVYFEVDPLSTATAGADYETLPEYAFFAPGASYTDVLVRTIDDDDPEGDETVTITLVAQPEYLNSLQSYAIGQPASATVIIEDDDFVGPLLPVSIEAIQDAFEGGSEGIFRISRVAPSNETITVIYQVDPDSTASPDDYHTLSGYVVIPGGQMSVDLVIVAIDDDLEEGDETLRITLTSVVSSTHTLTGHASAEILILDNDLPGAIPTVRIADRARAFEGGVSGWFRLARRGVDLSLPLTVYYTIDEPHSSAQNGVDFEFLPGTDANTPEGFVTFPPHQDTVLIPVVPLRVRSVRSDPVAGADIPGPWYPFTFYFQAPQAPSVQTLTLLVDTGPNATIEAAYNSGVRVADQALKQARQD
ncbi:MAG: choice-of-anchor D domain-containing protein, partial [Planctomycetaceae bacterium]